MDMDVSVLLANPDVVHDRDLGRRSKLSNFNLGGLSGPCRCMGVAQNYDRGVLKRVRTSPALQFNDTLALQPRDLQSATGRRTVKGSYRVAAFHRAFSSLASASDFTTVTFPSMSPP